MSVHSPALRRALEPIAVGAMALALLMPALPATTRGADTVPDEGAAAVIGRYRAQIPELMAEQGIPGLAVVVVDGDRVLWSEAFGRLERGGELPVTTDTAFSVQSLSKTFTATAVMVAVQQGLLELDEPISTYLPGFTVNSAFDEDPEGKITLRMLLSHTAGFTHEAPIGNNFELDQDDFDAHVRSISDTWLRFPVGTGYAYSNLGIDLAAAILERVSGRPFADVVRDSVLAPIGMEDSTFDPDEIRATVNRAIGHVPPLTDVPVRVPMMAAGGLYASIDDLARFLQFQLGDGVIDGRTVLEPALMAEMRAVPEPHPGAAVGYALGVDRTQWIAGRGAELFSHGGGGFGFLTDCWWLPQLQLGIAVLTNSADHELQGGLALSILDDLAHEPGSVYQDRLPALPSTGIPHLSDASYQLPAELRASIRDLAMPQTGDEQERWAAYSGNYRIPNFGIVDPTSPPDRFFVEDGAPYLETSDTGAIARHELTEIAPGLFLAENGETLDLRSSTATWRNLDLIPSTGGPSPWHWIGLGAAALAAGAWLIAAAVRAVRSMRRRPAGGRSDTQLTPAGRWMRRVAVAIAAVTAVAALANVGLVAAIPGLIDSGFVGYLEFSIPQRLALHLPFAVAALAACTLGFGAMGWARGWWSGIEAAQYAVLTVATAILVGELGAWGLIGWGFG